MAEAIVIEKAVAEDLSLGTGTVSRTNPAGGSMTGTAINLATWANGLTYSGTWDPGACTQGTPVTTDVTVSGAALGDVVAVSHSAAPIDGLRLSANVISANTVRVYLDNLTSTPQNLGSGTLRVLVFRVP